MYQRLARIILILIRIMGFLFPFYLWWLFYHYRTPNFWIATLVYCVLAFSFSFFAWWLLEREDANQGQEWRLEAIPDKENLREIRLKKYDHLNNEITRYRDLDWKIPTLAYGLYWGAREVLKDLPGDGLICFLYALTGFCATTFLLFCEYICHH